MYAVCNDLQVNNACSTGSSALLLAQQLVQGGVANCVMALGFEKMERGSLMAKVNTFSLIRELRFKV